MMKKNIRKGFTLIEVMIVTLLIAILTTIIVTYVASSGKFYKNVREDSNSMSEARIAMSYTVTKIRENDRKDAIDINSGKLTVKTLKKVGGIEKEEPYEIYFDSGKIHEKSKKPDGTEQIVDIANINSFNIDFIKDSDGNNTNQINIKVGYKKNASSSEELLDQTITTRCLN